MKNEVIKLVCFGQGGDTVHYAGGSTCSGYGNPDRPHAAEGKDIPDGTPVIDKRAAVDTSEGFKWVFRGPMVNVDLPDEGYEACPKPSETMIAGLQGSFNTMAGLHLASRAKGEPRGPLDYVSVAEYVRGWREHGARIGTYQGGAIVWE